MNGDSCAFFCTKSYEKGSPKAYHHVVYRMQSSETEGKSCPSLLFSAGCALLIDNSVTENGLATTASVDEWLTVVDMGQVR